MRFNTKNTEKQVTENYEGEIAYRESPELELYSAVCCASLQPKFYTDPDGELSRIRRLIRIVNPEFTAKLAVYTREEMHLRSVPLVLAVELARIHNGNDLVSRVVTRIIQRADELTEILAYYEYANNREGNKTLNKLSKQLQIGISNAFHKFDEHQLSKYNQDTRIRLRDVMFLTHTKPQDEREEFLFKQLADDTLKSPYTWEVELSRVGQKKYGTDELRELAFRSKWEELIDSGKLGYMALLRNLRNILNVNVSRDHIKEISRIISNSINVKKSKQLPFRFLSAYRELGGVNNQYTGMVLNSLNNAALICADNIQGYDYDTSVCIACDVSGSMMTPISKKSKIMYYDIGLLLAILLKNKCESVITGVFGTDWKVVQLPDRNVLQAVCSFNDYVGLSTNGWKVLDYLIGNKIRVDKIMMFTDCQLWDSSYSDHHIQKYWKEYKRISPETKIYLFDLTGYGDTPVRVNENNVYLIAGWSDKIFDVLEALDNGRKAIDVISEIEL